MAPAPRALPVAWAKATAMGEAPIPTPTQVRHQSQARTAVQQPRDTPSPHRHRNSGHFLFPVLAAAVSTRSVASKPSLVTPVSTNASPTPHGPAAWPQL